MFQTLSRFVSVICLLVVSTAAHGSSFSSACVVAKTNPAAPSLCPGDATDINTTTAGNEVTAHFAGGVVTVSALAQAAGPLSLRGSTSTSVTGGFAGNVSASSSAIFTDMITLTSPGVAAGTPGSIEFGFNVSGVIQALGAGSAGAGNLVQLIVNVNDGTPAVDSDFWQIIKIGPANMQVNQLVVTKPLDILYGVATRLDFLFHTVSANQIVTGDATTRAAFSSTASLVDIRGFDESMTQLSIDVVSDEGIEFPISMRVPEPSVGMLLASGLGALVFVQTRRRLHA